MRFAWRALVVCAALAFIAMNICTTLAIFSLPGFGQKPGSEFARSRPSSATRVRALPSASASRLLPEPSPLPPVDMDPLSRLEAPGNIELAAYEETVRKPEPVLRSSILHMPTPAAASSQTNSVLAPMRERTFSTASDYGSDCADVVPCCKPCTERCQDCCEPCCERCCSNPFEHRCGAFAEFLYLRAFGADMAHGIQQNGDGGLGTVPDGDVGVARPDWERTFRAGATWACSPCRSLTATYTQFESRTTDFLEAASGIGGTAASLVLHPGTVTSASTFDFLSADYSIDFRTGDVDYSILLTTSDCYAINYLIGGRYGQLKQDFSQLGEFAGALGEVQTTTHIAFEGGGLRTGFDGAVLLGETRFAVYGKTFVDVLFGQFRSNYEQFNVTTDTVEALSRWKDNRVLPILEYEAGLQWTSCKGCCRVSAGYYTAFWFNTVGTAEFIEAVQQAKFTDVAQTIDFTGFVGRVEFRF